MLIALLYFLIANLWRSRIGRAWYATRQDEDAAEILGVPTFRMKLLAFATGASTAGFAGAIYSSYVGYIVPTNFMLLTAIMILAAVVLGGMSNMKGAMVGAVVIVFLPGDLPRLRPDRASSIFGDDPRPHDDRPAGGPVSAAAAALPRCRDAAPGTRRGARVRPRSRGAAPILRCDGLDQALRRTDRPSTASTSPFRRGAHLRRHRPERRRQEHAVQSDQRQPRGRTRASVELDGHADLPG